MLNSLPVRLANLFVVAYGVDAVLSVVANSLFSESPLSLFWSLQNTVAYLALLLALLCLPVLAFAARLPTLMLVVLSTSTLWFSSGGAPVAILLTSTNDLALTLSGIQALLAAIALLYIRQRNSGESWLLRDSAGGGEAFSLRHTLQFVSAGLILAIPVGLGYLLVSLATWLEVETERFVQVDLSGIQLSDRRYVRDAQEIRLVAMMHLGEDATYEDLATSFVSANTIVLEEGVSDEEMTLESPISYEGFAESLGLRAQRGIGAYLDEAEYGDTNRDWPVLLNADVDASEFSPETIEYLALTADVWSTNDPLDAFLKLYQHALDHPELASLLFGDILDLRNDSLLDEIEVALPKFEKIIVPWGALHMPEIERNVLEQGFELEGETTRQIVSWQTIISALM